MSREETVIMKFGGASVATPQHFSRIAEIIVKRRKEFPRVIVVVSAMGDTTNELIQLALLVNPKPPQREYDMLVTVGERISISLLAMALAALGCEAVSHTGSQSGIITTNEHTDAKIIDVRPHRLVEQLDQGKVCIVAGFQGVSPEREITTLGRGGSDTTAVALGVALQAKRVEFYKDVKGIYTRDPKTCPDAQLIQQIDYRQALDLVQDGSRVLHHRCVLLAQRNHLPLHVRSFEGDPDDPCIGTTISDIEVPKSDQCYFEESSPLLSMNV